MEQKSISTQHKLLERLAQQYQEACINYKQLHQLREQTLRTPEAVDRENKLGEYQLGMEAMERKLLQLEKQYQNCLREVIQTKAGPSASH